MKILAIRGQNLASLGRFEISLGDGPLAQAGLFAITGPTGSGKTTLLDAMCLALFDNTPRLSARSSVTVCVGQDDPFALGTNDVRGLLRRGESEGFAEVDFLGQDGLTYQARWSVRRAHGKTKGKLQTAAMSFKELASDVSLTGKGKTETLERIEAKLGLSFDQFRRSVLLPQGEFDAFLKASGKVRGALLERMTGTEIFRRLSKAAHRAHAEALAALKRLQDELKLTAPLDNRPVVEAEAKETASALDAARLTREGLAQAAQWLKETEAHTQAITRAEEALAQAEAAKTALDGDAATLSARDQAAGPLAIWAKADALEEARIKAEAEASAAEEAWRQALTAEAQAKAALRGAEEAKLKVIADHAALAPTLAEARRLDGALAIARQEVEEATRLALEAAKAKDALALEAAEAKRLQAEREVAGEAAKVAFEALKGDQPLAQDQALWRGVIRRVSEAAKRLSSALAQRQQAIKRAQEAERAHTAAVQAHAQASQALDQAQAHRATLTAPDERALRDQQAEAKAAQTQAERLLELARRAHEARAAAEAKETAAQAAHSAAARFEARGNAASEQITAAKAAVAEARNTWERLKAAWGLTEHRAKLKAGEPCPLCGATEHPGLDVGPALIDDQAVRVRALEQALSEASEAASKAFAVAAGQRILATQAEEAAREARLAQANARQSWQSLSRTDEPDKHTALQLLEAAKVALAQVTEALTAAEAAQNAIRLADQEIHRARELKDQTQGAVAARLAEHAQHQATYQAAQATYDSEQAREQETTAELGALFALRPDFVGLDPDALERALTEAATAYTDAEARLKALTEAVERGRPELARWAERLLASEREAAARAQLKVEREQAAAALAKTRAATLEGRAVSAVEGELQAALAAAEASEASARLKAQKQSERQAAALQARTDRRAAVELALQEATRAAIDFEEALAGAGLAREALAQLKALSPAWCDDARRRVTAASKAVDLARALLTQRQADQAAHLEKPAPELPELPMDAAQAAAKLHEEAVAERLATLRAALSKDDETQAIRLKRQAELTALETTEANARALNELIGSSDGTAFCEFAQSLTLEALMGSANGYLNELARRYQLMRVPGENLELQVIDREMGNEVRAVQSLSGGESFLVSLALALGLSSLSSRDTSIGSLFIDEGLGTLDDDTLNQALAALDTLQASGRQVGLISHVPGLGERVGARIEVMPISPGRSRVVVVDEP